MAGHMTPIERLIRPHQGCSWAELDLLGILEQRFVGSVSIPPEIRLIQILQMLEEWRCIKTSIKFIYLNSVRTPTV